MFASAFLESNFRDRDYGSNRRRSRSGTGFREPRAFVGSNPLALIHFNGLGVKTGQCSYLSCDPPRTGSRGRVDLVEAATGEPFIPEGETCRFDCLSCSCDKSRPDSSGGTWNTTLNATGLFFASGYCPRI